MNPARPSRSRTMPRGLMSFLPLLYVRLGGPLCNDDTSGGPRAARRGGHHVSGPPSDPVSMGTLIEPRAWCRQRWCRDDPDAVHAPGDGCSCDPHGRGAAVELRRLRLKAHASRLDAFACRACGAKTRDMIEGPFAFFRCEPCAAADRWPRLGGSRGR